MKSPAIFFILITSDFSHTRHRECPPSGNLIANIQNHILQIDKNVALKQYVRTNMEFSKFDIELAIKPLDSSDAEKALLKSKLEMVAKHGDHLLRKIRNLQNPQ